MTDHELNATQLARATQIIQTYEQRAFPGGGSLLNRDPLYTQALLSALINDLEHYATNHELNFTEVINSGRATSPRNLGEDTAPPKVGDEVRLPCTATAAAPSSAGPTADPKPRRPSWSKFQASPTSSPHRPATWRRHRPSRERKRSWARSPMLTRPNTPTSPSPPGWPPPQHRTAQPPDATATS